MIRIRERIRDAAALSDSSEVSGGVAGLSVGVAVGKGAGAPVSVEELRAASGLFVSVGVVSGAVVFSGAATGVATGSAGAVVVVSGVAAGFLLVSLAGDSVGAALRFVGPIRSSSPYNEPFILR